MLNKLAKQLVILGATLGFAVTANAERVGDLTSVEGVRGNTLQGIGIVVGLPNTGDRGDFAEENLELLVQKYGIKVPPTVDLKSKNVAAAIVRATLPPFAKRGQRIPVEVSTMGDAKSLRGGTLINMALMGLDGQVYGVAGGQILVDGANATGLDGSSVNVNIATVGRIPAGGMVERELDYSSIFRGNSYVLNLDNSNFELATSITKAINDKYGAGSAEAIDAGSVRVSAPKSRDERVAYISMVDKVPVVMPEPEARIVINSRTGTVVFTKNVTLAPVAISVGSIVVNISEDQQASQPNALANGQTVVVNNSQVSIERHQSEVKALSSAGTFQDLVTALNSLGTSGTDLASIVQLLKDAGALNAMVITK